MGNSVNLPKIGWPCIVNHEEGLILGICMKIDSALNFGKGVHEEVSVHQFAQKLKGEDFFEPVKHCGVITCKPVDVISIHPVNLD